MDLVIGPIEQIEPIQHTAGISIFPPIELDKYLDDFVKSLRQLMIDDLIIPLLKSDNLSKSFKEVLPLHSMLARIFDTLMLTHYTSTELEELLIKEYKELQKELMNLESYLAENIVSILAGLDAQFEYAIGIIEVSQKNPKLILELQLPQYLELLNIVSSLSLCLISTILVAQDKIKISEIKIKNLRTLALWSESYASQLMIIAQKLSLTDGMKLIKCLDKSNKISDILKELIY